MVTITIPAQAASDKAATMAFVSALVHALALEFPPDPDALRELDGHHWALDADCSWVARIKGRRLTIAADSGFSPSEEWLVAMAAWIRLRCLFRRRPYILLA
jgi:hypothetical protein